MRKKLGDNQISDKKNILTEQAKTERQKKITKILFVVFVVLLVLLLIFVFFCSPAMIYGESMLPTLNDGQIVMISKVNKNPQIGDIVVYRKPGENKKVIKRVVGVAGDTFYFTRNSTSASAHIVKKDSSVSYSLSNEQFFFLSEQFNKKVYSGKYSGYFYFNIQKDEIFTIGDNFDNSIDGRNYGPIKIKDLIGIKI